MKTITIPKRFGYPTVDITINGKEETFASGVEINVEDSVAEAIENAIALAPKIGVPRNKVAQLAEGSITEITAEDLAGVSTLLDFAFYYKQKLKRVTLPDHITAIGNYAFQWCVELGEVYLPEKPPTLASSNVFSNIKTDCIFYCKTQESLNAYEKAQSWSVLAKNYSFAVKS